MSRRPPPSPDTFSVLANHHALQAHYTIAQRECRAAGVVWGLVCRLVRCLSHARSATWWTRRDATPQAGRRLGGGGVCAACCQASTHHTRTHLREVVRAIVPHLPHLPNPVTQCRGSTFACRTCTRTRRKCLHDLTKRVRPSDTSPPSASPRMTATVTYSRHLKPDTRTSRATRASCRHQPM